jgi:hypothetical protein
LTARKNKRIDPEIEKWNLEHPEAPTTTERSYTDLKKTEVDVHTWITKSGKRKTKRRPARVSISDADKALAQSSAKTVKVQVTEEPGAYPLDKLLGGDGASGFVSTGFLPGDSSRNHGDGPRAGTPWWLVERGDFHRQRLQEFLLFETSNAGKRWETAGRVLIGYYVLNQSDLELLRKHQHSKTLAGARRYRERLVAAGNVFFERKTKQQ